MIESLYVLRLDNEIAVDANMDSVLLLSRRVIIGSNGNTSEGRNCTKASFLPGMLKSAHETV